MKKNLRALGVVLLLFVFPAMSWYYLQMGYDYQLQSQTDLTPKDSLDYRLFILEGDTLKAQEVFGGKTTVLLHNDHETVKKEDLAVILDQFENSFSFQFVHLVDDPLKYSTKVGSKEYKTVYDIKGDYLSKPNSKGLSLIDESLKVRSYYNGDKEGLRSMIEHVAFILPAVTAKDIKLKRDLKK